MREIGKGLAYLKSVPSILKIIEFVILLVGIGTVGFFFNKADSNAGAFFTLYGKKWNLELFLAAAAIAFISVVVVFTVCISGLYEKVCGANWTLTVAIISAILAALLLAGSAVLADAVRVFEENTTYKSGGFSQTGIVCDALDKAKADYQCGHLIAGTVCGFVVMVQLVFDAIFHMYMYKNRET